MNRILLSTTLTLAAATSLTARGADSPDPLNRFSLGPRFGFNFKADFRNVPLPFAPLPATSPGPVAGGVDHTYDDGYVRLDASGNAGGLTWNWGYQNASQVVGDTMQFHARQAQSGFGPSSQRASDDLQYGLELTYQRVIGNFLSSGHWGFEAAFGYTDLDLRAQRSGVGSSKLTTDSFPLNGVLPPGAGYNGTFVGPGALLGDFPTRSIAHGTVSSREKLSGQIYGFRIGPFAEWNLTPHLSLAASVGLTVAPASVDYEFSETARIAGGGTFVTSGHSSKSDVLFGPYASAMLRYDFTERWGVYMGAQFQNLGSLQQSSGTRTARLDQSATIYATVGATWKF
jgi:hypothetical protein